MNNKLYSKVESLANGIKQDLRKKGFVVPCDNGDGTISVDDYTIVRHKTGFYSVKNRIGDNLVENINLPQTAALIANSLALGKWVDNELVDCDRQYGFNLFTETLTKQNAERSLKKKDVDRADMLFTKCSIARSKKLAAHATILNSFEKLRRLR